MKLTVLCICVLLGLASSQLVLAGKKGGDGGGKGAHAGGGAGQGAHMGGAGHGNGAAQHNAHSNMHSNGQVAHAGNGNAGANHHGLNSHNRVAAHGLNGKGQNGLAARHNANAFHNSHNQMARINGRHWNSTHWRNSHFVYANYHGAWHDHGWYSSHYDVVTVGGGWGPWYWDSGYWYPAWGYDPRFVTYGCDCPVYAYANLPPDQVVVNVQESLQDQGYYAGTIDGQLGQQTRDALGQYQKEHDLEITSAIDEPTVQALGLDQQA
jgi:hypothetical protein